VGLGAILLVSQNALAHQLDNWKLLPHKQSLSELYFTEHKQLAAVSNTNNPIALSFTVRNREVRTTAYTFTITGKNARSGATYQFGGGAFSVDSKQAHVEQQQLAMPNEDGRIVLTVTISYKTTDYGHTTTQTQSIYHWVTRITPPPPPPAEEPSYDDEYYEEDL